MWGLAQRRGDREREWGAGAWTHLGTPHLTGARGSPGTRGPPGHGLKRIGGRRNTPDTLAESARSRTVCTAFGDQAGRGTGPPKVPTHTAAARVRVSPVRENRRSGEGSEPRNIGFSRRFASSPGELSPGARPCHGLNLSLRPRGRTLLVPWDFPRKRIFLAAEFFIQQEAQRTVDYFILEI